MEINLLFLILGAILIYAVDLYPAFRNKNRKAAAIISMLVFSSAVMLVIKFIGWPSPMELIHEWLSPLGRIIWRS